MVGDDIDDALPEAFVGLLGCILDSEMGPESILRDVMPISELRGDIAFQLRC